MTTEWAPPEAEDLYVAWDDDEAPDPNGDAPEVAHRLVRTEREPSAASVALGRLLREARIARETAAAFDAGGDATVILPSSPVADSDLPPAARRIMQRCRAAMWDVEAQQTRVAVTDLLYVGETEAHNRGDVRTPAHEVMYFGVQGVLELPAGVVAAFWATWARKATPGEKPGGNAFESAITWDPLEGRIPSASATDFDEWLAIFAPKPEPKARRSPKEDRA